jgi:phosphonopyruvate decarboxylase
MIKPAELYHLFQQSQLTFFTGVPDSLLKDFCAYITDNTSKDKNIIAANEGNAIGLASGYHLASGRIPVVYMQNSGLGNCVNPLTSLTDKEVYSIPMLLVIGWRGEPGRKDEPQHVKKGMITLGLLNTLGVPYAILPDTNEESAKVIGNAVDYMKKNKAPFAIVVRKGTFDRYELQEKKETNYPLNREEAIKLIVPLLGENDIIVSTTGKTSREVFEFRRNSGMGHNRDFLTVGSMGHSSSIALGISLQKPSKQVYCFDGDGAVIMHMGALSTIGQLQPKNFKHIVFNNFAHDSVGGQPTAADVIDIPQIAKANGYKEVLCAETKEQIQENFLKMKEMQGPVLLEVKVNKGARENLGRPNRTPIENKQDFMEFLGEKD